MGQRTTFGIETGTRLRSVHLSLAGAAAFSVASCLTGNALAFGNLIGFGAGLYADSSERRNDIEPSIGGVAEVDGSFDYEADSTLNLQLWYLRAAKEAGTFRILWGGGIAFYNDFSVVEEPENEDEEVEPERFGNLFQVYFQGDMAIPIAKDGALELLIGGRLGPMILFQSRDLDREIEDLSQQGVSVWPSAPRLGGFLGPHVGLMWGFSERIGLRFDAGVQFAWLSLYSGESDVGGTIERSASLTTTRFQGLLGLQVGF